MSSSTEESLERLESEGPLPDETARAGDAMRAEPPGSDEDGRAANIRQIRGSSLLLVGRMLGLALDFVAQVLIVRHLTKADYGAFALALSIVAIGTTISLLGSERTIGRFAPIYQERGDHGRMWGSILVVLLTVITIGIAVVIATFAFQGLLFGIVDNPLALSVLLVMIVLSPLQALDALLVALFATFGSARSIFFRRYVFAPVLQLSIVIAVILSSNGVELLALGYVLAAAVGIAIYSVVLVRLLAKQGLFAQFRRDELRLPFREIYTFSIPLLASDLVFVLRGSLTVVLIEILRTTEEVAEFRAVLPVAIQNLFVATSFRFIFTPGASRLYARDDRRALDDLYWQTAVWIAILTFPLVGLCVAFGEPLTVLLFGERYRGAGIVLSILAIGYYINGAVGFNSLLLRVFGRVRYMVTTDLATAAISVVVSIILIRQFGAIGAAIGTTATLLLQNVLYQWGLRTRTTVAAFDRRYLRAYASIAIGIVALVAINAIAHPNLLIAVILDGLVSLAVFGLNRHDLRILETYPELGRFRIIRRLFGGPALATTETGHMETADQSRRRRLPDVFLSLAYLFSPAGPGVRSSILQADESWPTPGTNANVDVVLWGRLPRNERPTLALIPQIVRREAAVARLRLAPPEGLNLADLHRLPPVRRAGRLRGTIRVAMLSGVLAELVRGHRPTRVIDAVIEAAGGVTLASAVRPSGDGSALATLRQVDGSPAELRTSKVGHPKDPERGRSALIALEGANVPLVPRPLRAGTTAGAAWATETVLSGVHPMRLSPSLLSDVTDLLVRLPSDGSPSRAVDDQLREVGLAFPNLASRLEAVATVVRGWSAEVPSVLIHGDLWLNNVLVADGRLSGIIDWDTWHPAGIPGTDLLNLLAAEERTRSRRDVGALLIGDYWRSRDVLDAYVPYMARRGLAMPELAGQAAIGVAWWASRLAASLDRGGRPTDDPDWVARNLVEPLDRVERLERELG